MKYRHIAYKEHYDINTGDISLLTPCPYAKGVKVASNECWQCKHFIALYQSGEVECANPIQFNKEPVQLDLFQSAANQKKQKVSKKVCEPQLSLFPT